MHRTTTPRRGIAVGLTALAAASAATVGTLAMTGSSAAPDRAFAQTDTTLVSEDPVNDNTNPSISVTGTASVDVAPDTAHVSMGVRHRADSAEVALDTVSTKTAQLIQTLTAAGVAKKDIQTTSLSVWPSYGGENGDRITGYEASNSVTVTTTDIAGLGTLIDQVSEVAGNDFTLDGVSFSVADPDAALAAVRPDAVADARAKAEQYVSAEDLEVGDIRSIVENGSVSPPIPFDVMRAEAAADASVPIEPGEQELSVTVTVTFELS